MFGSHITGEPGFWEAVVATAVVAVIAGVAFAASIIDRARNRRFYG